jgi:hypothetical protein
MGLDMYLSASKYLGGWEHSSQEEKDAFDKVVKALAIEGGPSDHSPSITVDVTVGYWRKANAIHNWFVQNAQDGVDNCEKAYVSREKLVELLKTCQKVLKAKGKKDAKEKVLSILPPQGGFFFGSTDVDDDYWDDIKLTISQIENILNNKKFENFEFYYQASW